MLSPVLTEELSLKGSKATMIKYAYTLVKHIRPVVSVRLSKVVSKVEFLETESISIRDLSLKFSHFPPSHMRYYLHPI